MEGKKILVVDSDAASRNFVSNALSQQKYTVLPIGSGKEGLALAWRDYPDLIVIEPVLPDMSGEELAGKLRQDPRSRSIPLLALSMDNRPARLKSCLVAGFDEYLVKSGQVVPALLEAVERLLGSAAEEAAPIAVRNGLSFVFISAKGGIGTSSICANLAMNIGQNHPDALVALADLVLPIGSIASILGHEGRDNLVTIADLAPGQTPAHLLRNHLAPVEPWHLHLLPGSPDPESASSLQVDHIGGIVEQLKVAFDYVILDVGRSLSKFTLPLIQQADLVVLVVGADLSSTTINKTLLAYLHSKGVENRSIYPILNRAVGLEGLTRAEAEKALGVEIKTSIPYLPYLTLANNLHQPFSLKFPNDTAALVFRDIAGQMVGMAQHIRAAKESA